MHGTRAIKVFIAYSRNVPDMLTTGEIKVGDSFFMENSGMNSNGDAGGGRSAGMAGGFRRVTPGVPLGRTQMGNAADVGKLRMKFVDEEIVTFKITCKNGPK